jgi:hypothetical protein
MWDDKPKSEWRHVKGQKQGHNGNCEIIERRRADKEPK